MNKGVVRTIGILFLTLFIFSFFGWTEVRAAVTFMGGKLMLKGSFDEFWLVRTYIPKRERAFHDSNVGLLLSTARFEALYTMVQKGDLTINLQSIVRYYYEAITNLDRQMHDGIPPGIRNQFHTPRYFHDDPLNEFYIDIIKGPWNFKLGKQIVTWGETSLVRTSDVVNPLDLRYGHPGYMPFEDLKISLFMLRTFYQSTLPGGLLFETIFIPGDHQMFRLPPEGTNWGPGLGPGIPGAAGFGNYMFTMLQNGWKDDAPRRFRNIKNYQWGMRVRGTGKGVDWTLQYFDSVDFTPTGIPDAVNQQATAYIATYFHNGLKPSTDVPKVADRVWDYKRTKYVGATLQYYEERYIDAVIRSELCYQIGKYYTKKNIHGKEVFVPYFELYGITEGGPSTSTSLITERVKKDAFSYGLSFDKKVLWPLLMQYNTGRALSVNFQVYQDWIIQHERELSVSGRGMGDRNVTCLSLQLQTDWMRQTLTTTWTSLYNTSGHGYNVVDLFYAPGDHWRYQVGCMFLYSFTQWNQESNSYDKDMFYFRVKYEW